MSKEVILRLNRVSSDSCQQATWDSNAIKCDLFDFRVQELQEFKLTLVDGPKPTNGLDVNVMDILIFTWFLLCYILGHLVLGGVSVQAPSTYVFSIFETYIHRVQF